MYRTTEDIRALSLERGSWPTSCNLKIKDGSKLGPGYKYSWRKMEAAIRTRQSWMETGCSDKA